MDTVLQADQYRGHLLGLAATSWQWPNKQQRFSQGQLPVERAPSARIGVPTNTHSRCLPLYAPTSTKSYRHLNALHCFMTTILFCSILAELNSAGALAREEAWSILHSSKLSPFAVSCRACSRSPGEGKQSPRI